MLRVTAIAPGPVWLELTAPEVGGQCFGAADLAALVREFPRGAMRGRLTPSGSLYVEGATLVGASTNLAIAGPPTVDLLATKAERRAAREAAWATVNFGTLLRGYPVRVLRPATLVWLRASPVERWPPVRVGIAEDGSAYLVDGNHRVAVAREFGAAVVGAQVRAGGRVVYAGPVGV